MTVETLRFSSGVWLWTSYVVLAVLGSPLEGSCFEVEPMRMESVTHRTILRRPQR